MKTILLIIAAAGLAVAGRPKLVHLLTVTTGTWVGTPENHTR